MSTKKAGDICPDCENGELIPFTHRTPEPKGKDQKTCFNGIPKEDHICVDKCSKPGLLCRACRRLTDLHGIAKNAEREREREDIAGSRGGHAGRAEGDDSPAG